MLGTRHNDKEEARSSCAGLQQLMIDEKRGNCVFKAKSEEVMSREEEKARKQEKRKVPSHSVDFLSDVLTNPTHFYPHPLTTYHRRLTSILGTHPSVFPYTNDRWFESICSSQPSVWILRRRKKKEERNKRSEINEKKRWRK
jgi:hypothetical protein